MSETMKYNFRPQHADITGIIRLRKYWFEHFGNR